MNLDLLQNLDFKQNRFLRGAPQLLVTEPSTPILGELLVYDSTAPAAQAKRLAVYDSINEGSPFSTWRLLAGLNRNDQVTGLWTWIPPIRGGGVGSGAPFVLSGPTAFNPNPGTQLQNWVAHLNADYLDGRGAEEWADAAPSGLVIPVSNSTGQLRVNDPVKDFDAVNRRTLLATSAGLVVVAPCKVATTARLAGARSGNVITASANGVYAPDGVTLALSDRILLKDQEQGGTGIDNGIYTVTTLGTASVPVVLTRASDADATGELTVGTLVFISSGTVNAATQWSCQRPPGVGGGSIIAINSDIQLWQKTFGQSAYTEGRGIKFNGLEINFAQTTDYTVGNVFYATAARTMGPLANPTTSAFLHHSGTAGAAPNWTGIQIQDIIDWPDPVVISGAFGIYPRIPRFTGVNTIESSRLEDYVTGNSFRAYGNTVVAPTVGLGDVTHPYGFLWTSLLRLKPTAGASNVLSLLGVQNDLTDPNTDHKTVVTWGVSSVKSWLNYTSSDVGAVASTRTLTFVGDTFVQVAAPAAQDLSADRTWNLSLNTTLLDTRWVTVATAQDITAVKRWKTSSASTNLIELWTTPNTVPSLSITAGGSVQWGDGLVAPVGGIQLQNDRLSAYGKTWEFTSTSQVKFTSAITTTGAPTFVLGLDASDMVRRVNLSDLLTYTGVPALTKYAVGYGDVNSKLTGNPAFVSWLYDASFGPTANAGRFGIRTGSPATTLDVIGDVHIGTTLATGFAAIPYSLSVITNDTSTSSADWTSRNLYGGYFQTQKSGSATYLTSATMTSLMGYASVVGGSLFNLIAVRANLAIGGTGVAVTAAYNFYSAFSTISQVGSVTQLVQFQATDFGTTLPQPSEHYCFYATNMSSTAGATRTAGLRLDIGSSGVGERYNIYSPGLAVSYLAGNLGLGNNAPTARLEFVAGTLTLAPMRFAPNSSVATMLTTVLPCMFECSGLRLHYTDTNTVRHPLAFYDDFNFTNDGAGDAGGAVAFDATARMQATLDLVNSVGQGDFTLWSRFRMNPVFRGPQGEGVCSVSGGNTPSASYNNGARIFVSGGGQIYFYLSKDGSNYMLLKSQIGMFTIFGGKVIDVVIVRSGTASPKMYINGIQQTTTEQAVGTSTSWDQSVDSFYLGAGVDYAGFGSVPEIYRVAFFNFAMPAADVGNLCRYGHVDTVDKWAKMAAVTIANPGFEGSFGGGTPTGWSKGATVVCADETTPANVHGGAHSCRLTVVGTAGGSSGNWLSQNVLVPNKRHLAKAWVLRAGGTGTLQFGCGYQSMTGSYNSFATITSASIWTQIGGLAVAVDGNVAGFSNSLAFGGFPSGDQWFIDDVTLFQVGALCDYDFAIGCGSTVPDRSGRYPGTLTGAFEHIVPTCPTEMPQGPGTISRGLRRYAQTISAKDGDTVTVTHSLNTQNITVAVWNAAGASVACAVNRKAGPPATNPDNVVELGFALIGAPTPPGTTVNLLVVIIG